LVEKRCILLLVSAAILALTVSGCASTAQRETVLYEAFADLNEDGVLEHYTLKEGVLSVMEDSTEIWRSPEGTRVQHFAIGDIDGDGRDDLAISLWRRGSFGRHKPFWHTEADDAFQNHLFIYHMREGVLRPMWCSSALRKPIASLSIDQGEQGPTLTVWEGQYKKPYGKTYALDETHGYEELTWRWSEWGFVLVQP